MNRQMKGPESKMRRTGRWVAPWLYFSVLTVFMTWPLVQFAGDHVFGNLGDNFYFLWLVRWFEGVLHRLPASPLVVPNLNYPEGWNLAYNEIPLTMVIQALPISVFFGTTAGFNFSVWLSFLLSGMGAYFLVRRITQSTPAALLSGTIFAFAPYRYGHMMGHFNLMGTQWLPFYFLALYRCLESIANRTRFVARLAAAALCLGLIGLTSQYYLYMTLVLTTAFFAGFLIWGTDRATRNHSSTYRRLIAAAGLLTGVALLCALPYLSLLRQVTIPPRSPAEMAFWSPSLADFFIPSPYHFLLRGWVMRHFNRILWVENNLYLGFVPLILAIYALVFSNKKTKDRRIIALFAFLFVCAFTLALGTRLKIVPTAFDPAAARSLSSPSLPLPGALLVRFLPFYDRLRVFSRYGIFAILFMAVLSGFGARYILEHFHLGKRSAVVTALLAMLIVLEFKESQLPFLGTEGRPVDRWLARRNGPGSVAQFPATEMVKPEQVFYTSIHGKPYVGTMGAAFLSPQWRRIFPVLRQFPDGESVALLKELGVGYVLVDSTLYGNFGRVQAEIARFGLTLLAQEGNIFVYSPR
jgi:hypothetical protein